MMPVFFVLFSINPRKFTVGNLRLLGSDIGDSFNSVLRRFFAPTSIKTDTSTLKMRVDVSEKGNAQEVKTDIQLSRKKTSTCASKAIWFRSIRRSIAKMNPGTREDKS